MEAQVTMKRYTHKQLAMMVFNCKVCMRLLRKEIAREVGSHTSKAKAAASKANGRLGGRPRTK